jgi:hypothetical protein
MLRKGFDEFIIKKFIFQFNMTDKERESISLGMTRGKTI